MSNHFSDNTEMLSGGLRFRRELPVSKVHGLKLKNHKWKKRQKELEQGKGQRMKLDS